MPAEGRAVLREGEHAAQRGFSSASRLDPLPFRPARASPGQSTTGLLHKQPCEMTPRKSSQLDRSIRSHLNLYESHNATEPCYDMGRENLHHEQRFDYHGTMANPYCGV